MQNLKGIPSKEMVGLGNGRKEEGPREGGSVMSELPFKSWKGCLVFN